LLQRSCRFVETEWRHRFGGKLVVKTGSKSITLSVYRRGL
jgi:hypothetical protein